MAGATKLITPSGGGVLITPNANISSDITLNLPTSGVNGGTVVATNSSGNVSLSGNLSLSGTATVSGVTNIGTTGGAAKLNIITSAPTAIGAGVTVTASPPDTDSEELLVFSNSSSINGLTFSSTDPRLLTFGIATNNAVYMRAANPAIVTNNTFRVQRSASEVCLAVDTNYNTQIYNSRASNWGDRTLLLQCSGGTQPGIGFHAPSSSSAGIFKYYGPGARFEFRNADDTGFLDAWANTFVNTSDYRLKENVIPVENGIDKIKLLKPCSFIWKQTGDAGMGFIAHELQEVIPQAVHGEKDAVQEDNQPEYQGINIDAVVSVLTKAVQEQQEQIEQLKAEVEALKGAK